MKATVLGFIFESPVVEFPVRTGPGTNFARAAFKARKGAADLTILDIQPDATGTRNDANRSRVYQWFKLDFGGGEVGWLRGHVVGLSGDMNEWGYGNVGSRVRHAYTLLRDESRRPTTQPVTSGPEPAKPTSPVMPLPKPPVPPPVDAPATPTQGTGDPVAIVIAQNSANARGGPGLNFAVVTSVPRGTRMPLRDVQREAGGFFRWYKINFNGRDAWVREDLVTYGGATDSLGLPSDLYPTPMGENYWWGRDYNFPATLQPGKARHLGWDYTSVLGEGIFCGPNGGEVVWTLNCIRCTADRPSTLQHGLGLANPAVFRDAAWGFGYGNLVVVRYANELLPQSTRQVMADNGFGGGSMFVMYAHLSQRHVETGAQLTGRARIGSAGNTGNSTGVHLHLEVRASDRSEFRGWATVKDGLMNPGVLFKR